VGREEKIQVALAETEVGTIIVSTCQWVGVEATLKMTMMLPCMEDNKQV
jgi:hypothetical protein